MHMCARGVDSRSELTTAILSTDAKRCELKPGFFSLITQTDVGIKC